MADTSPTPMDHFRQVFAFAVGNSAIILAYLFTITFIAIPEKNQRFVDLSIGFLFSNLNLIIGFYFGSSSGSTKKPTNTPQGASTAEITASITTDPTPSDPDKGKV